MNLSLKEKLYLYKDLKKINEQLQNIIINLAFININLDNNKEIDKSIDKIKENCENELNIIKEILINKLNLKEKLKKNVISKITLENILEL